MKNKKELSRKKRHKRIRVRLFGTAQKPRLVVHRSLKNMQAQLVDDAENRTIFSLMTKGGGNIKTAENFGAEFAKKAKEKGVSQVVFDRAGYLYHGRLKAFAEGTRKGGLVF